MSEQLELDAKTSKKERVKYTSAQDVIQALRDRYPANAYAFLTEVADATGFARRHCDALIMSLWPSRGLEIIGIEVKVSRSDWLRELERPEKAEAIAQWCDRWFLAVGDEEIVKEGELPASWGLYVPSKTGLRCKFPAKQAEPEPQPDRRFLAAVLRSVAAQMIPEAQLQAEFMRGRQQGRNDAEAADWHKRELAELKKTVQNFEKAAGIKITNRWGDEQRIGEAVRSVLNGTVGNIQDDLARLHASALRIVTDIENELEIKPKK